MKCTYCFLVFVSRVGILIVGFDAVELMMSSLVVEFVICNFLGCCALRLA